MNTVATNDTVAMQSKKAFFEAAAAGARIRRTILKGLALEDWDEQDVVEQLLAQGARRKDIRIDSAGISIGQQFWLKPKWHRVTEGALTVRSTQFIFESDDGGRCFGDQVGYKLVEGGLVRDFGTHTIRYEALAPEGC